MKKVFLRIIVSSFFILTASASNSFAALDYNTVYMVTDNNSLTLSTDTNGDYRYSHTETPWAYIKLKLDELNLNAPLHLLWSWSSFSNPSTNQVNLQSFNLSGLATDKEIWSSAPEPWWTNNKADGKWTVDIGWLNAQGSMGTSSATFNVTPEPISSALFLLGGFPLAGALLRRNRKTV